MTRRIIPFTRRARTIAARADELRRLNTLRALAAQFGKRVKVTKEARS